MTKISELKADVGTSVLPAAKRKTWTPPRIDRIDAGQAEVGTRAVADGPFSTS